MSNYHSTPCDGSDIFDSSLFLTNSFYKIIRFTIFFMSSKISNSRFKWNFDFKIPSHLRPITTSYFRTSVQIGCSLRPLFFMWFFFKNRDHVIGKDTMWDLLRSLIVNGRLSTSLSIMAP